MNKKGFTLAELLMVSTLIGIISLLAIPNIIGIYKKFKDNEYQGFLNDVFLATEAYVQKNSETYPKLKNANGKAYVYFSELINSGFLKSSTYDPKNKKQIKEEDYTIEITYNINSEYKYILHEERINESLKISTTIKNVNIGSTLTLSYDAINVDESELTWTSSDNAKATVSSSGVVTGISNGTVDITVSADEVSDTITLDVYKAYSVVNMITNGGYEDGLLEWNNNGYVSDVSDIVYSGNYALRFNHNNGADYSPTTYQSLTVSYPSYGHKYYGALMFKSSSTFGYGDVTDSRFEWRLSDAPSDNSDTTLVFANKNIKTDAWTKISNIVSVASDTYTNSGYSWSVRNFQRGATEYSYCDNLMIIDLTETFGIGNEPSKEWCDKNINWFDGTTTIYYK